MAAIKFTVTRCSPSLPVIEKVCFKVVGDNKTFYVTSQPVYLWPGASPYQTIAQADIQSLVSVRDAAEYIIPFNPFDLTETDQCHNIPHRDVAGAIRPAGVPCRDHEGLLLGRPRLGRFRGLPDHLLRVQQPAGAGFRAASPRAAEPAVRRQYK